MQAQFLHKNSELNFIHSRTEVSSCKACSLNYLLITSYLRSNAFVLIRSRDCIMLDENFRTMQIYMYQIKRTARIAATGIKPTRTGR